MPYLDGVDFISGEREGILAVFEYESPDFDLQPSEIEELTSRDRESWTIDDWKKWALFNQEAATYFSKVSVNLLRENMMLSARKKKVGRPKKQLDGLLIEKSILATKRRVGRPKKYDTQIDAWIKALPVIISRDPKKSASQHIRETLIELKGKANREEARNIEKRFHDNKKKNSRKITKTSREIQTKSISYGNASAIVTRHFSKGKY